MFSKPSLPNRDRVQSRAAGSSSSKSKCPRFRHVHPSSQCSICSGEIHVEEMTISLFGDDHLYKGQTPPYPLPALDTCSYMFNEYVICRKTYCRFEHSNEYTTAHVQCYDIYIKVCSVGKIETEYALKRLWTFAAWRLPWQEAPSMPQSNLDIPTNTKSLQAMGRTFGIPFLHRLPRELLLAVWGSSKTSLFWRCVSIIKFTTEFKETASELQVRPLDEIVSWSRNGNLECGPPSATYPVTRLTIDQEGIREVERLRSRPQYAGDVNSPFTFIVEEGSSLRSIEALFQDGKLRLRTTKPQSEYPYIWNTSAPPRFSLCKGPMVFDFDSRRLHVVNTRKLTGITFLFVEGVLHSIYTHESAWSNAGSLDKQLSPVMRRGAFWHYLPIGPTDKMIVFGTRFYSLKELNFLIRMDKAGDVVIGRNSFFTEETFRYTGINPADWPTNRSDQCLSGDGPISLLYGEPVQGSNIPLIGAYCETGTWTLPKPFILGKPTANGFDRYSYYSRAPLDEVAESTLYYKEETGSCLGIVFRYKNGGYRAVGQCRVNVDPCETVAEPNWINIRRVNYRSPGGLLLDKTIVKITCDEEGDFEELEEGCRRLPVKGHMEFYFDMGHIHIDVTAEFHEDVVRPIECSKDLLHDIDMAYIPPDLFAEKRRKMEQ